MEPFRDIFLSEELSDVLVIVENNPNKFNFPAHSPVLKRTSPVFTRMLESEFAEGQSKIITITDFEVNHVRQFLKFLYTKTLPETYASLCEIMKLAHKYMVQNLTERCEEALLNWVNFQNIYELCNLSELYSLKRLRSKALAFIKRAAFKLLKLDELECLSKETMKDLVSADDLHVRREVEVFWAIWKWGNLNVSSEGKDITNENIKGFIGDLLKHVRWHLISDEEREQFQSLGITVDDLDIENRQGRKPSLTDSATFLNECNVLNLGDFSNYCNSYVKNIHRYSSIECNYLRLLSLADAPFYVVGVLFMCKGNPDGGQLISHCNSLSSDSFIDYKNSKAIAVGTNSEMHKVICEFLNPVEVCKNQTLTINGLCGYHPEISLVEIHLNQRLVWDGNGRSLRVDGNILGIQKLFIL